jgi:hypothetical protein
MLFITLVFYYGRQFCFTNITNKALIKKKKKTRHRNGTDNNIHDNFSQMCWHSVREIIFHISFILIYYTSLKYYYYYLFAAALYHQLQLLKETDGEAKTDGYVSSDDDGLFLDYWPMLFWPTFWLLF